MINEKTGERIELISPAKINLFLIVKGKRPDGYHELLTLMCPVGLSDRIQIKLGVSETRMICDEEGVPCDESNLALKAFILFLNTLQLQIPAEIRIEKRIPVGGGLGGGSSNAATVLAGLNKKFNDPFSSEQLMQMGLKLGADVPFFILNKPAVATGIGEKLTPYPNLYPYKVVIVSPGFSISTADVYKNLNLRLTNCKKKLSSSSFKQYFNPVFHLCNDLESVTLPLYPVISEIKNELLDWGAEGALMSGSGSSVFGLFLNDEQAQKAAFHLSEKYKVFLTEIIL